MKEKTIEEMLTEEEQKERKENLGDFSQYMNPPEKPESFDKFMNKPITEFDFADLENDKPDITSYVATDVVDDIVSGDFDINGAQLVGFCIGEDMGEKNVYLLFELPSGVRWAMCLMRP